MVPFFFPGLDINTNIYQPLKTLCHPRNFTFSNRSLLANTRCIATSRCSQPHIQKLNCTLNPLLAKTPVWEFLPLQYRIHNPYLTFTVFFKVFWEAENSESSKHYLKAYDLYMYKSCPSVVPFVGPSVCYYIQKGREV